MNKIFILFLSFSIGVLGQTKKQKLYYSADNKAITAEEFMAEDLSNYVIKEYENDTQLFNFLVPKVTNAIISSEFETQLNSVLRKKEGFLDSTKKGIALVVLNETHGEWKILKKKKLKKLKDYKICFINSTDSTTLPKKYKKYKWEIDSEKLSINDYFFSHKATNGNVVLIHKDKSYAAYYDLNSLEGVIE